jgi:hypothetical protein
MTKGLITSKNVLQQVTEAEDLFYEDDYEGYHEDYDVAPCVACNGTGETIVCTEKLCQGSGMCPHPNGSEPCPNCKRALMK